MWLCVDGKFRPQHNPRALRTGRSKHNVYYQRKSAKTNGIVAIKTVAHKLARACYYILRDGTDFEVTRAFT